MSVRGWAVGLLRGRLGGLAWRERGPLAAGAGPPPVPCPPGWLAD